MTSSQGFEHFVRKHQNMVFTTAVRIVGNKTDAEDIAQEVFLRAFKHYDSISQSETAGGWLKVVTRNLCINHLTRYRNRWKMFTDQFTRRGKGEDVEYFFLPEDEAGALDPDKIDRKEIIGQALHALPEKQRVPLVLYHFENMSYLEIARHLRLSLSKVKTDIFRGRRALKKILLITLDYSDENLTES